MEIGSDRSTHLYRTAREAFANIARHSVPTLVTLVMSLTWAAPVRREVAQNGSGIDRLVGASGVALGLRTMVHRGLLTGANLEVEARLGGGIFVAYDLTPDDFAQRA